HLVSSYFDDVFSSKGRALDPIRQKKQARKPSPIRTTKISDSQNHVSDDEHQVVGSATRNFQLLSPLSPIESIPGSPTSLPALLPSSPVDSLELHAQQHTSPSKPPVPPRPSAASTILHQHQHQQQNQQHQQQQPISALPAEFSRQYIVRDELGVGGYGHIFSAIRRRDRKEVAVKILPRANIAPNRWTFDIDLGWVPIEVYVMKNVRHPGVIAFHDLLQTESSLFIVMEIFGSSWKNVLYSTFSQQQQCIYNQYPSTPLHSSSCPVPIRPIRKRSTDLFELLEVRALSEDEVQILFAQIARIVHDLLVNYGLCHGDIKDENILIEWSIPNCPRVKLIDYGGSSFIVRIKPSMPTPSEPTPHHHTSSRSRTSSHRSSTSVSSLPALIEESSEDEESEEESEQSSSATATATTTAHAIAE
ncbi:hypothetical protein HK102_011033, partial [Quaeritorhiza haematococci]